MKYGVGTEGRPTLGAHVLTDLKRLSGHSFQVVDRIYQKRGRGPERRGTKST